MRTKVLSALFVLLFSTAAFAQRSTRAELSYIDCSALLFSRDVKPGLRAAFMMEDCVPSTDFFFEVGSAFYFNGYNDANIGLLFPLGIGYKLPIPIEAVSIKEHMRFAPLVCYTDKELCGGWAPEMGISINVLEKYSVFVFYGIQLYGNKGYMDMTRGLNFGFGYTF